jgi:diguanylate cyclase (GGDEF)-like protein/PAS domain S-box-containing protein
MSQPEFRPPLLDYPTDIPLEELSRLFCQDVGASISVVGLDCCFKFVSEPFAKALGFTAQQMQGMTMQEAYGDMHFNAVTPYLKRAFAGEELNYERFGRMVLRDGIWRTVALRPWRDAHGNIIGAISASMVVHELKVQAEKLRVAGERLASHMENSPLTVLDLDSELNITHASFRAGSMFGFDGRSLEGRNLFEALGGQSAESLQTAFARLQTGRETRNRVDSVHARPDGTLVHCEWFNSALTDASGHVTSVMCLVEDVTVRVEAEMKLRRMAMHDQLTGLPNRASLAERLKASLARAQRSRETVGLLFIDLDGFKSVNDQFGHAAGDEVLREVADRLGGCVRDTDTVARLGGDEFVILLEPDSGADGADIVAERVLQALAPRFRFREGEASIGASIGIAQNPPLPGVATELLKRADAAMYEAKRAGKGCVRHAQ